MQTPPANLYEFGDFQLDTAKRRLRRLDGTTIPLTPRVFDTLLYMIEHHDSALDKERIMAAVWPDSIVEENNLAQAISKLRQVFGETPGSHSYIVTIPGRGYRFVAEVKEKTATSATPERSDAGRTDAVSAASKAFGAEQATAQARIRESPEVGPVLEPRKLSGLPTKTRWLWAAAISAIVIVGLASWFSVRHRSPGSSAARSTVLSAPVSVPEKSVAVLPFENLSDEKQNAYFAAGVQDEITSNLARIAELKVISRTSANLYKSGNPRNSREIGQQLGVAHLLEGSVQRIGNRVRVNAQLIDSRSDAHSWAQTYDRDVSDFFAIQSEIAQAIAGQLYAKISPAEKRAIERPPTANLNAFDLYSRAKNLLLASYSSNGRANLLQAADLLNQAIAQDPAFFQAYCQLAFAHDHIYFLGFERTPARLALAEGAIQAAFRLRPDAGEAHLARAEHLYRGYLDYRSALAELDLAAQTLPNEPRVFELKAYIERRQGKHHEALRSLERAMDLDPRNFFILQQITLSYELLRRYAEEKSVLDRMLVIEPNDPETKVTRSFVELDWKADTKPLHQLIDSIRAATPATIPDIADSWFLCALAERDPAAAATALTAAGENGFGIDAIRLTHTFGEGLIARMSKDEGKARSAFTAARAEQEKIVAAQPDYGPAVCVLGLIDAYLGRTEEALREGRRAVELLPVETDAINGPHMIEFLAIMAAWAGDEDLACKQLATAIGYPGRLSYGQLKLLPFWDPLRGDPRFEQIVASLAPK
jgi:TolB-like protein/DNA-binding winged helix-turn-helix (wHTH) protein/Tfp pilus assembly protein PilF